MGLLKLRRQTQPIPEEPLPPPTPMRTCYVSGNGVVDVVGESHYQENIGAIVGPKAEDPMHRAVPVDLVPEPQNPYDRNAVRCEVLGRLVGYLSRADASRYQPVLLQLAQQGYRGHCTGIVVGGWRREEMVQTIIVDAWHRVADRVVTRQVDDGMWGVRLLLGRAEALMTANQPSGASFVVLPGDQRRVSLVNEQHYQDAIGRYREWIDRNLGRAFVTLYVVGQDPQKHRPSGACIEVRLDGQPVGHLTAKMTERYLPIVTELLDAGVQPWAEIRIKTELRQGSTRYECWLILAEPDDT
jgi:HIRAN domain